MHRKEHSEALAAIMTRLVEEQGDNRPNRIARRADIDNSTLAKMMEGIRPRPEIVERVAKTWPELTDALYAATGYERPASLNPVVARVARETGRSPQEIVDEAVRKMFDGE